MLAMAKPAAVERERNEIVERAWVQCERFLHVARKGYAARLAREGQAVALAAPSNLDRIGAAFRRQARASMRFPAVEAAFPAPWPAAARRVLPSASPKFTATAMWGPVLGWCALQALAEFVAGDGKERTAADLAIDLFDRLRLREPLARTFETLGLEGEEAWRGVARIKVLLLVQAAAAASAKAGEVPAAARPAGEAKRPVAVESEAMAAAAEGSLPPALWRDADVRWLTGLHEAEGHLYPIREHYEELLWWLEMPALLGLASCPAPGYEAAGQVDKAVREALKVVEDLRYRVDELPGVVPAAETPAEETAETEEPLPPAEAVAKETKETEDREK